MGHHGTYIRHQGYPRFRLSVAPAGWRSWCTRKKTVPNCRIICRTSLFVVINGQAMDV